MPTARGSLNDTFRRLSARVARGVGTPWAFVVACLAVVVWAALGPVFTYSDAWQLVINTSTTIVTFLVVFLIQNTQSRDSHAMHLKLDELIRVNRSARDHLMQLEELDEKEISELQQEFAQLATAKSHEKRRSAPRLKEP